MKNPHKITIALDGNPSRKLTEAILESWDYSKITNVEYSDFRWFFNECLNVLQLDNSQ
jgi:hypothetical protein